METLDTLIRSQALPATYRQMVDRVHRPAAERIAEVRRSLGRPVVAGLCGSQGSGKSTMALFLKSLLEGRGLKTAILSLDDLYLTLEQRGRLGVDVNPLLKTRGVPGTHDVGLGLALIDVLSDGGAEVSMPRFDKAEDGPDLLTQGSSDFIQTLFRHDLVDELTVLTFPVVLGGGKRLFQDGAAPKAFTLTGTVVSGTGVMVGKYAKAGAVATGSFQIDPPTEQEAERRRHPA